VAGHGGDGHRLTENATIWQTPGHTPQDASLVVRTSEGLVAFTHLWWREDRSPDVDPYASDPEALAAGRRRLLGAVDLVVPGHGSPFRTR
jgi:glyoxylase-like metal-dependent hydrolase (beta-lactamase superfamily II)